jgi:hypothetical protein
LLKVGNKEIFRNKNVRENSRKGISVKDIERQMFRKIFREKSPKKNFRNKFGKKSSEKIRENTEKITHSLEVFVVSFEPTLGWSAHVLNNTLSIKYTQVLYPVDKEDFPWTQFVGNCCLTKNFLVVTPTTPGHEIHLWTRGQASLGPYMCTCFFRGGVSYIRGGGKIGRPHF